jgi:hypothetical protein
VDAVADLQRDLDTPPPSGVRLCVVDFQDQAGGAAPSPAAVVAPDPDVLVEVAEEVFFEVWDVVRALSPLQSSWLKIGLGQLGAAALTMGLWRRGPHQGPARLLRERWPELVPGYAAMDRLAEVMVDTLC